MGLAADGKVARLTWEGVFEETGLSPLSCFKNDGGESATPRADGKGNAAVLGCRKGVCGVDPGVRRGVRLPLAGVLGVLSAS